MPKAKMLRAYFCESDRYEGKPLHEAVVDKCRELEIAGATVFRGLEGFGEGAEIHRGGIITRDLPIVVAIIDAAERIDALAPVLESMMDTGTIAISEVEMQRVEATLPRAAS